MIANASKRPWSLYHYLEMLGADIDGEGNYTLATPSYALRDVVTHCRRLNCAWLSLPHLAQLQNPPILLPNPELSGVGAILGFSITAYLTLLLLILHYLTVHDVRRTEAANVVDRGVLDFVRRRIISWKPSRRFEYAMDKSVLILSDTQLVTGLGILAAGYSQLQCGISAYHWQIMVFVAWFASFSFLSAMTFLEGHFQTNNKMRLIRVSFMFVLASLLIAALLPTGSKDWLDLLEGGERYFPSLSTSCFYKQMSMGSYLSNGPKIWSMVFSVFIVAFSFFHCALRLFNLGVGLPRRCFRTWPGTKINPVLQYLEQRAIRKGLRARLWLVPYLAVYAIFVCCRALCDILGSMLFEIIRLSFAIAWGTINIWATRSAVNVDFDSNRFSLHSDVSEENIWSFGQTLPLVLILLPLLSMAQAYLDDDAKLHDDRKVQTAQNTLPVHGDKHSPGGTTDTANSSDASEDTSLPSIEPHGQQATSPAPRDILSRYPYPSFTSHPWYHDLIFLLLCQTLMFTTVSLYVLTQFASILGISAILRNRMFLIWVFSMVPLTSLLHLAAWYLAAVVSRGREWWTGRVGKVVYWVLRMGLVGGCLVFTLMGSLEAASPLRLADSV